MKEVVAVGAERVDVGVALGEVLDAALAGAALELVGGDVGVGAWRLLNYLGLGLLLLRGEERAVRVGGVCWCWCCCGRGLRRGLRRG